MRNILKAAFIVIAILAISCDKSEDLSSKDLIGSWYLESVTYGGQPQGLSSCAKQSNIVFTETEYTKTEYQESMVVSVLRLIKNRDLYNIWLYYIGNTPREKSI